MPTDSQWVSNIGFRHVIEDGIQILNGETIADDRRSYVLDRLTERFKSAEEGFALAKGSSLFIGKSGQAANASSQMMRQYLRGFKEEKLTNSVSATVRVFQTVRDAPNGRSTERDRAAAIKVLAAILEGLEREAERRIPFMPQDIRARR
ncbi:MAG: hypothetical protein NBV67_15220 [Tagaea sp.]|nr:hypothetical protein [Tagaea sp.]